MHIKLGDKVAIIAGKNRFVTDENGKKIIKTGKILKIFHKQQKVLVEGINIVFKHKAPLKDEDKGNIIKQEAPIHISNVALIDSLKNVPTRVGYRIENNKKVRYFKKSGTIIEDLN
ncbi:50S ribosomal protein L24 [Candidatus Phytoplasma mali]|uniref:Large ribosomal subunit protein uL24 n=1 Tax=Phytoplasma mali (strain AT) TaxID=482235 RepID=RL24_PHYMT|nr:50S ribosomal protein L24 [Candidatus Phytoplasma mali]B3R002.1 RecName: Full=Large ribosomal subunit protein uL24; AltName: Full=50S ribosomal protein L24 [Candidatus Phytoplasma mali AT]CAP18539.1 50S ribosomal protein L24 [Candidatus Phytoplasma mali]